jgi:arabinosyltransferase B
MPSPTSRSRTWVAVAVGLTGLLAALALPFAPVFVTVTTVTWPAADEPVESSTAIFAPYRPTTFSASVPCTALRAAGNGGPVTVLATGTAGDGLVLTARAEQAVLQLDDRRLDLAIPGGRIDCRLAISSDAAGVTVSTPDGRVVELADQLVPEVFGFRTDLGSTQAQGMTATARVTSPFATTPAPLKIVLIAAQLLAVGLALVLLLPARTRLPRFRRSRLWWIDGAVLAALCGWAVIGPLSVDDGWATTIARNMAATGNPGNYYRWWDAAESPFAFSQQLLAPLTEISIAPLWLRLPSTVLAAATWFVLSRGVLGNVVPGSATARVRILAAVFLLAAWLPFNLGTRPEAYVALGITAALALALRVDGRAGLGLLALVVGLTIPISPNGLLVIAPILVCAPRLLAALGATGRTRLQVSADVALLCCVAAIGLTIVFADQTWDGVATATDWHAYFGPTIPWYHEADRYAYLLEHSQQGTSVKRLPVLLSVALLPIIGLLTIRRPDPDGLGGKVLRLGAVVIVSLMLLALTPSKWSYHFGAAAGIFAAFLASAIVLLFRRATAPGRAVVLIGVAGSILLAASAALAFDGPNEWWLGTLYDVPLATVSFRPLGVPFDHPLLWIAVVAVAIVVTGLSRPQKFSRMARRAGAAGPALIAVTAGGTALVVLFGSFIDAPARRPAGSIALANLKRITGDKVCGLADDVEVMPDGNALAPAEPDGEMAGFTAQGGRHPAAPPPDSVGTGASKFLWGSDTAGAQTTGSVSTRWFVLPALAPNDGVAVSVSGDTTGANLLTFEFGHATGAGIAALGQRTPNGRGLSGDDPAKPTWRTMGVDASDVPARADRVRIRAVDGSTDAFGWLAFTGPRLRSVVGLTAFLADNGPVLTAWPMGYVFPCVHNIAEVSGGVAQTPRTVIESPRPRATEDRQRDIGGTFAELEMFGKLREVPSRLRNHPDVDWGSVWVSGDTAAHDSYQRTISRTIVPGAGATRGPRPER